MQRHWNFSVTQKITLHQLVEELFHRTDTTYFSKRATAVIADIKIKNQATEENDTLQIE